MVEEPDRLAHLYVEAGCERLIVHAEACLHLHRVLGAIAELGATRGGGPQPGHAGVGTWPTCSTWSTWCWS